MTRLIDTQTGQPKPTPPPPSDARLYRSSNGDKVYDTDDLEHPRRWRFRHGKLIVFIVYEYHDWVHPRENKAAGMKRGMVERRVRPLAEYRE